MEEQRRDVFLIIYRDEFSLEQYDMEVLRYLDIAHPFGAFVVLTDEVTANRLRKDGQVVRVIDFFDSRKWRVERL